MNFLNMFLITPLSMLVTASPFDRKHQGYTNGTYYINCINYVLCTILFVVLVIALGLYCILFKIVPLTTKNSKNLKLRISTNKSDKPDDVNIHQLLVKTSQEIEIEFNLLEVHLKSNQSKNVAMEPRNKSKNRYSDILPYDNNRVIIKSDENDYINASYIQDTKSDQKYIACQGPLTNTCKDMWQMILDHDVTSIVMLCNFFENHKIKCEKYYPSTEKPLNFGNITIYNDNMIVNEERFFTISRLRVVKENVCKRINHFQFHDWPDFETPKISSVLLEFCLEVRDKSLDGLIVVHCSAGVGRTGTFIACDMLLRLIQQNVQRLNVFETVLNLREQRNKMVQTQVQYNFIYKVLTCKILQNH